MATVPYSNTEVNRFWLQIMGDDARLVLESISAGDTDTATKAQGFIKLFDDLLARARKDMTPDELTALNKDGFAAVQQIRTFILAILNLQVTKNYYILLRPGILNEMVTMDDEYLQLVNTFMRGSLPTYDPKYQDIFWLPMCVANARYITDSLGIAQSNLRGQGEAFASKFQNLLTESIELQGIYRIGTTDFPIANQHQTEMIEQMRRFSEFLSALLLMMQQNRLPGSFSVLYLDRTQRKLCYCMIQLIQQSGYDKPICDPFRPRIT